MSEQLAERIRSILGPYNDDTESLQNLVSNIVLQLDELKAAQATVNQQLPKGWKIKKVDADKISFLVTHPDGSSILLQDGQPGIIAHIFIELCEAIAAAQEQKV